jgi:hypothetical protein
LISITFGGASAQNKNGLSRKKPYDLLLGPAAGSLPDLQAMNNLRLAKAFGPT